MKIYNLTAAYVNFSANGALINNAASSSTGGYFKASGNYTSALIAVGNLTYNFSTSTATQFQYLNLKNFTFFT
jgi:hypothetical protein